MLCHFSHSLCLKSDRDLPEMPFENLVAIYKQMSFSCCLISFSLILFRFFSLLQTTRLLCNHLNTEKWACMIKRCCGWIAQGTLNIIDIFKTNFECVNRKNLRGGIFIFFFFHHAFYSHQFPSWSRIINISALSLSLLLLFTLHFPSLVCVSK